MAGGAVANADTSAKDLIVAMSDEDKSALKGWYWYDWANQAYALTVMTVIVPAPVSYTHLTLPTNHPV